MLEFEHNNPKAWTAPGKGSIERCDVPNMGTLDLTKLFFYLSASLQQSFWLFLFNIAHPNFKQEQEERICKLEEAVAQFKQDLASIGIDVDPLTLLQDKKMAIENRLIALFDVKIEKENHEAFWGHATKIWNLANPYDQIKNSKGLVLQLKNAMGDIFSTVKSTIESSESAPENPFGFMNATIGNIVPNLYQTLNNASPQEQQEVLQETFSLFSQMMKKFTGDAQV